MTSKGITRARLAILVALAALGASPVLSAADASPEVAKPTAVPAPPAGPAALAQAKPEERAAQAAEGTPSATAAPQTTVEAVPAQAHPPEEKPVEPITGAFGLTLGTRFEPSLVEKVLSEEPKSYRVADRSERLGTLYRIVPKSPDPNFSEYTIATTEDGTIYRIDGEFADVDSRSKCALIREIADGLSEKHGKPRGRGTFGERYAFRDLTAEGYRGIRIYAVRCRRGIYSISYEDATLTIGPPPGQRKTEAEPGGLKGVPITPPRRPQIPEPGPEPIEGAEPAAAPESAAGQGN